MDIHPLDPTPDDPPRWHWAGVDALVAQAERNRRELARLHAERAELCAHALDLVHDRVAQRAAEGTPHRGTWGDDIPLREMIAELGAALRVGDQTIRTWLGDGSLLTSHYRATLDALRDGRIDERHASAIIDGGAPLTDEEIRTEYESRVLALAEHETAARVRDLARVLAARLQPGVVDERQRTAHARRGVRLIQIEDGISRVQADVPAALGHAVFDRLTEMARGLADADAGDDCAEGERDERTLDQRRADLFCDLLLCGSPTTGGAALAAIRGSVQVTVPVLTLAGLGNEPALLAGHGPIDSDTARRIAAGAPGWDRILTHPHTGEPIACDRYRPSAELRRYLTARDEHCRWPGCRREAARCDADHTIAFSEGGATEARNLSLLCRRHHRLKHASRWRVRQLGGGRMEFASPTGRTYRTDAPAVVTFVSRSEKWRAPYDPGDPAPF